MRTSPPPILAAGLPARRFPLPSALTPDEAVLWLRDDTRPFALVGEWLGVVAVLGSEPVAIADPADDPFQLLDEQPPLPPGEVRVGGGWVGWLGYELGSRIEHLPPSPPAPTPRDPFSLAYHDHVIVFDGERWWFEALWHPDRDGPLRERLELWHVRMGSSPKRPRPVALTPFVPGAGGAAAHVAAVRDARERIAAGELSQANLCLRLQARSHGAPLDLFARALPTARPRFGAFVDGTVSLSPERFLRRVGREVSTEPIKGTRARHGDEAEQAAALRELLRSAKDAAEHVMIVDLMRNDLGRVCDFGSVKVEGPRAEPHAGVWHLVSHVGGALRPGVGDGTLLRATFPPGSVTGAPKVQAMKVIAALEGTRREAYTGAVGIASPVAGLELSVAIRTFEFQDDVVWLGVGGGIVADSDSEAELAEALAKAAGPVAAIGGTVGAVRTGPGRLPPGGRPAPPARALDHGLRPDPRRGVFETLLVKDGDALRLAEHLARLEHSLSMLYGRELPPRTAQDAHAAAAAAPAPRARLRILADPYGHVSVAVTAELPDPDASVVLVPFALPGGLGAHKWRDRALIEALAAATGGATPLIVDDDGLVLEAATSSVWIAEGDALVTPPADGRILPGVTQAMILVSEPGAREEPIELERLLAAEAIYLSSALAPWRPAKVAWP